MKDKDKVAARVLAGPSHNPRNPRKGRRKVKAEGLVAVDGRVVDNGVVEDAEGRWALAGRVVDTIDLLFRRRMIDQRQRAAGATYRDAVDAVGGSGACALDMTRVRRSGGSGGPIPSAMWGASTLAEARGVLGQYQGRVVASVLAEGRTLDETARRMMGEAASQRDIEFIGRTFREALTELADLWHPVVRSRMNGTMADGARPSAHNAGEDEPGHVAHATSNRIFDTRK